ncbi:DUF4129 domain-containing protein [Actinomadura sp. HBU206391]|uniref:DUF4129 domain-containing protein n=1 Tax=Actinomadura sp. HBU206391 TaxID=2731692 RepID=UPI001650145E|nr:DUF4129 domain-containing protein [Actinomadura sp. HBU206391]MBC6456776.1 DUF4129 domain-containing protein [Actinomadura sp. HBU206391]
MILGEPIGRDEARELARRELEDPAYHRDQPSLVERLIQRISEWFQEIFNKIFDSSRGGSGGGWTAVIVFCVIFLVIVGIVFWVMRGRRNVKSDRADALLGAEHSSARDHRADAMRLAAAGQWAEAIRERLRAVARDLEERVILDPRPGRTADELATEAAQALPDIAEAFHAGVRVFDDVWYGDRPGTREGYEHLAVLDELTQAATPRPLEAGELADANFRSPQ